MTMTDLRKAAERGDNDVLQTVLRSGFFDLNDVDEFGYTPRSVYATPPTCSTRQGWRSAHHNG